MILGYMSTMDHNDFFSSIYGYQQYETHKKAEPIPPTLKFQVFVCFNFLVFWVYPSVHANPFNGCLANSTKRHEEYAEQQCESENTNANNKPKGNLIYVIINLLSNFVKHLFRLD